MDTKTWYNTIAPSYEELYGEEQFRKVIFIKDLYRRLFGNYKFKRGLDFGCGTGISIELLLEIVEEPYACDISEKLLNIAKHKYPNVNYIKCEGLANEFRDFFDVIISITVLQDVENPLGVLYLFKQILQDHGIVILSVLKKKGISYWKPIVKEYFNILWFDEEDKDFVFFLSKKKEL